MSVTDSCGPLPELKHHLREPVQLVNRYAVNHSPHRLRFASLYRRSPKRTWFIQTPTSLGNQLLSLQPVPCERSRSCPASRVSTRSGGIQPFSRSDELVSKRMKRFHPIPFDLKLPAKKALVEPRASRFAVALDPIVTEFWE